MLKKSLFAMLVLEHNNVGAYTRVKLFLARCTEKRSTLRVVGSEETGLCSYKWLASKIAEREHGLSHLSTVQVHATARRPDLGGVD